MAALETLPAEGTVIGAPEPVLSGTFALYESPDGSMVISYRLGDGTEGRRRIPKAMVKAGMKMAARGGGPGGVD